MLSTKVVGSEKLQLSARPGFGFKVSKSHSVSESYIVNRKAWSDPAPPVAGSRLEGLVKAEMRKIPPRFGAPCARALPPSATPATAPDMSAIASRRVAPGARIFCFVMALSSVERECCQFGEKFGRSAKWQATQRSAATSRQPGACS